MKLYKILGLTIALGFLLLGVSCEAQSNKKNKATTAPTPPSTVQGVAQNISVSEFQEKLAAKSNAILLDVRTPEEYANGHLQQSTLLDFTDTNFKTNVSKLDRSKPIFVYCAAGGRSSKALKLMQELGFKEVYNMIGGFSAWEAKGFPSAK